MKRLWRVYKKIFAGGGVILLLVLGSYYLFFKPHYPTEPLRIGVVDFVRLSKESKPFQYINEYWENKNTEAERMIFNSDNELRQEYKNLREKEKHATKPSQALLAQKQAFEKKLVELEQLVQHRRMEFNKQRNVFNERLNQKIKEILEAIAKSENIHLIINRAISDDVPIILYTRETLDVTDKVIVKLDASIHEFEMID